MNNLDCFHHEDSHHSLLSHNLYGIYVLLCLPFDIALLCDVPDRHSFVHSSQFGYHLHILIDSLSICSILACSVNPLYVGYIARTIVSTAPLLWDILLNFNDPAHTT